MKLNYDVNEYGTKFYTNAKRQWHRTDGPAVEFPDGTKYWYRNDKLCRTDGPAIEYANGSKYWYLHGKFLTEAEFNERTKPVVKAKLQTIVLDGVTYKLVKA